MAARGRLPRVFLVPLWVQVVVWACPHPGCGPDTDLVGEKAPAADPSNSTAVAGAAALVDPAAGATAVPPNLAAILVRFQVAVSLSEGAFVIRGGGQAAPSDAPAAADCPGGGGSCFQVRLTGPLLPSQTYVVFLAEGALDLDGHSLPPGPIGQFATATEADVTAPTIAGLSADPSGSCILVGFETDESAAGAVVVRGGGIERSTSAGAGQSRFSVAAPMAAFAGGTVVEVSVRVVDLAGNVAESAAVSMTIPEDLLPLAITEIRANPAGPEPAQEFVELRNLAGAALDLAGLALEDSKGSDVLVAAARLPAGGYALIVPAGFDPSSPLDTPPRPGTALVRVDSRLGGDGLANPGEVVRLRTSQGTVVSSYGGGVDVSASKWAGKTVHRMPEDACDQPASWSRSPAAATPGWGSP